MRAGGTGDDRAFYFLPVSGLEGRYMLSWDHSKALEAPPVPSSNLPALNVLMLCRYICHAYLLSEPETTEQNPHLDQVFKRLFKSLQ